MATQILKYSLVIDGESVSHDMTAANVREAANERPVATFDLANTNGKYTNPASFSDGQSVVFSASTDGSTFARLHSGSIILRSAGVDANGRSLLSVQTRLATLDHAYVSFNNAVHRDRDFGAIFTGSPTASDGSAWSQDGKGNYPNGLLYGTTVQWDPLNTSDIYPGSPDAPLVFHGNRSIWDAAIGIADIYGFDVFLRPSGSEVYLSTLRRGTAAPSSGVTYTYGQDINADEISFEGSDNVSGVTIIGDGGVYYRTGSPPYAQLIDQTVRNYDQARERAKTWLELHTVSFPKGSVTVPADTRSLLGKRVTIADAARGFAAPFIGNVIGVNHAIASDRWTTNLTLDNPPKETVKLLADVITEIKERQQQDEIASRYPGFSFINFSDFFETFSSVGTEYSASAAQIGTGGDTIMAVLPVAVRAHPIYTFNLASIPEQMIVGILYNSTSELLKQISIHEFKTGSPRVTSISNTSLTRPTVVGDWGSSSTSPFFRNLGASGWVFAVQNIFVKGLTFTPRHMDLRLTTHIVDGAGNSLNMTDSAWEASTVYILSESDAISMSWDAFSKSDGFFRFATNSGADKKRPVLRFAIPTNIPQSERGFTQIPFNLVVARCKYTDSGNAQQNRVEYIGYGHDDGAVEMFQALSGNAGQWLLLSDSVAPSPWFKEDGTHYFAVQAGTDMGANSGIEFDVAFAEVGIPRDRRRLMERAVQVNPYLIEVLEPVQTVFGVFDNPSALGLDYRFAAIETVADRTWVDYGFLNAVGGAGQAEALKKKTGQLNWNITQNRRGIETLGPPSWAEIKERYTVSDLYVHYLPENDRYGSTDFESQGWLLNRRSSNVDQLWWINGTTSDLYLRFNKPAYGLTYSVQYTEAGEVKGRYTDSVGWDLTKDKTLTIVFNASA